MSTDAHCSSLGHLASGFLGVALLLLLLLPELAKRSGSAVLRARHAHPDTIGGLALSGRGLLGLFLLVADFVRPDRELSGHCGVHKKGEVLLPSRLPPPPRCTGAHTQQHRVTAPAISVWVSVFSSAAWSRLARGVSMDPAVDLSGINFVEFCHVAVDIGGTNARVSIGSIARLVSVAKFQASSRAQLVEGLNAVARDLEARCPGLRPRACCVAVAGPVHRAQSAVITNYAGASEEERTLRPEHFPALLHGKSKDAPAVVFLNDLEAACYGLAVLRCAFARACVYVLMKSLMPPAPPTPWRTTSR